MNDAEVDDTARRFTAVWIVPLAAVVVGAWIVVQSYLSEGPTVHVRFATAEGLKAGETRVKRLSVDLGLVEEVYLNDGYDDVTVVLRLDHGVEDLLRQDTQFWVVRPRIGTGGVSGLSTLLSGAYIELSPGTGDPGRRTYRGLEDLPITPQSAPGVHVQLTSDRAASLSVGSPVLYNGYRVGQVEESTLSVDDGKAHFQVFIDAPYSDLVTSSTRFWNASGIRLDAGADGIAVRTESLEALLTGGVAFGLPSDIGPGRPVDADHQFFLHPDHKSINEHPYHFAREYLLLFDSSVRGLHPGAPVDYRGVRLGTVLEVSLDLVAGSGGWSGSDHALMPVLIRVDPGRLGNDTDAGLEEIEGIIFNGVASGLRASLASGNLLTGSLYVALDFFDEAEPAELAQLGGRTVLPTTTAGLDHLQVQVSTLLDKLQELPLENALVSATGMLDSLHATAATANRTLTDVNRMLEDPNIRNTPEKLVAVLDDLGEVLAGLAPGSPVYSELNATLRELRATLHSAGQLTTTLEAKPSSLVFSGRRAQDAIPEISP